MNRLLIGEIDFLKPIALMMRHGDDQMQGIVNRPSLWAIVVSEIKSIDLRHNPARNSIAAQCGKAIAVHQRLEQRRVEEHQMGGGKHQAGFGIDMAVR